jgi:hypothetical protein
MPVVIGIFIHKYKTMLTPVKNQVLLVIGSVTVVLGNITEQTALMLVFVQNIFYSPRRP